MHLRIKAGKKTLKQERRFQLFFAKCYIQKGAQSGMASSQEFCFSGFLIAITVMNFLWNLSIEAGQLLT